MLSGFSQSSGTPSALNKPFQESTSEKEQVEFVAVIITNRASCSQALFNITRLKQMARTIGMVSPNTSKTIRL
jgi:hypothetical protein